MCLFFFENMGCGSAIQTYLIAFALHHVSLRTWAAAQQFKPVWLHSPCTMFLWEHGLRLSNSNLFDCIRLAPCFFENMGCDSAIQTYLIAFALHHVSLRTWAAAQQFKPVWLHSPCTLFVSSLSHIARYARTFTNKKYTINLSELLELL